MFRWWRWRRRPDGHGDGGTDGDGDGDGDGRAHADAAAAAVLEARGGEAWASLDPDERVVTLRDLRKYLPYCPLCGGALDDEETEPVETCSTESERVLMATCVDCDVRLIGDLDGR